MKEKANGLLNRKLMFPLYYISVREREREKERAKRIVTITII